MAESGLRRAEAIVFGPPARLLLKAHISPNMVTVAGTAIVCAAALGLYPRGHAVAATLVIAVIAFTDSLDGTMARISGTSSDFGAFLDSTLDRVADAAIFGGMALYFARTTADPWPPALCVMVMAFAFLISYTRSRAEYFGYDAHVGLAERFPRTVLAMAIMLAAGLGAPQLVVTWGLAVLWIACLVTAIHRIEAVYRQSKCGERPLREHMVARWCGPDGAQLPGGGGGAAGAQSVGDGHDQTPTDDAINKEDPA